MEQTTQSVSFVDNSAPCTGLELFGIHGPLTGRRIELRQKQLLIGRGTSGGTWLKIPDKRMSREHARIEKRDSGFELHDCSSKNGTWHNGTAADGRRLSEQDVVRIGDSIFVVTRRVAGKIPKNPVISSHSPLVAELNQTLEKVVAGELTMTIQGETGTGKGFLAETVHRTSRRRGPFIVVNCAAIPNQLVERELFGNVRGAYTGADRAGEGYIESAAGGTLFLDEISEMPLAAQAKLLHFLDSKQVVRVGASTGRAVDVRVITASNQDLLKLSQEKRFRIDLYARIEGILITLPALRSRREDLGLLLDDLSRAAFGRVPERSADLVESIALHSWPRNIRELSKTIERVAALNADAERLTHHMLPDELQKPLLLRHKTPSDSKPDRSQLLELLAEQKWSVRATANLLGRPRRTIYRWIKEYAIDLEQLRAR